MGAYSNHGWRGNPQRAEIVGRAKEKLPCSSHRFQRLRRKARPRNRANPASLPTHLPKSRAETRTSMSPRDPRRVTTPIQSRSRPWVRCGSA